jgi:hypothetical protein
METNKTTENFVYGCPNCQRPLAVGRLFSLFVICPDCGKWLNYEPKTEGGANSGPTLKSDYGEVVAIKDHINGTFGQDRLTIEQMELTKEAAIKAGHSHYFTGRPCRNGHLAPRTKRGECNECVRQYARNHLEKIRKVKKT